MIQEKNHDERYCTECGGVVKIKAEVCIHCGCRQLTLGKKSRMTAILLAFFLGGVGAHKFYLGNIAMGFVYLIFCWTLVPAIGAFIEFIIYLCMTDEKFNLKYGNQ